MRLLAVAVATLVVLGVWLRPEAQTRAHDRWVAGECASCHDEPPTTHQDPAWSLSHGRLGHEDRCFTCHSARSCRDCHARAPTTHTPGFVAPGQANVDATAHAMLGRLHPTSCLTCHRELTAECTTCHPVAEVWSWEGRAREALERWQPLLHEAVETTP